MGQIKCGPGSATFTISNEGTAHASLSGLIVPANAGALSALLLAAGVNEGASGLICTVQRALLAIPPINPQHYYYVPASMRSTPVAIVLSPEQADIYEGAARAAALCGTTRRAFLSRDAAEAWLREQQAALAANRAWWSVHRSTP